VRLAKPPIQKRTYTLKIVSQEKLTGYSQETFTNRLLSKLKSRIVMESFRKSVAWILVAVALIISVIVPFSIVKANWVPYPMVYIDSPHSWGYTTNQIPLNVTVKTVWEASDVNRTISYTLDAGEIIPIKCSYQGYENYEGTVTGEALLTGLSEGSHTIAIYTSPFAHGICAQVQFEVDIPTIKVNLNNSQAFETKSPVPYSITVNAPFAWFTNLTINGEFTTIGYTLDNKDSFIIASDEMSSNESSLSLANNSISALMENLSSQQRNLIFSGNLPEMPAGNHSVKAYVIWAYPRNASPITATSEASYFSISSQSSTQQVFVFIPIVIATFAFLISALALRHRRQVKKI
jgi:hypothetical protein